MIARGFTGLALLGIAALGGTTWYLHQANARVRARIDALPPPREVQSLQATNRQLKEIVTRADAGDATVADALHAEVVRAAAKVAELEQHAVARRADMQASAAKEAEMLAHNHDPFTGVVRPENFQARGQNTPSEAFQTLIASAAKNDEAALAKLVRLSADALPKAEEMIASLPLAARGDWTPEKLALLYVASVVTDFTGVQILGETLHGDHATVAFKILGKPEANTRAELERGPDGWRVIIVAEQIEVLKRRLARAAVAGETR